MFPQFFFETICELRGFSCSAYSIVLTVNVSTQVETCFVRKNLQHVKPFLSKILLSITDLSPTGSRHNSSKLQESASAGRDHFNGEAPLCVLVSVFTHDYSLVLPVRWPRGLGVRPLACWDCGFESHQGNGPFSVVSVVCCQVEVSATSWSLIQSCRLWCVVVCDLETSWMRKPWSTGCRRAKNKLFGLFLMLHILYSNTWLDELKSFST